MKLADSSELALPAAGCPGVPAALGPSGGPGPAVVRIAVCYDGCWYQNVARFFVRMRGQQLSVAGLHDVFRWHAARVFGCPVQRVAVVQAHYVAGRDPGGSSADWDQVLADHAIVRHDVPVTARKGEVGADVELALTCYQLACEGSLDMIVLVAGDGDFAPLVARLAGRGLRVLVPRANLSYLAGRETVAAATSGLVTGRATDSPALLGMLDAAMGPDYPLCLRRPLTPAAGSGSACAAEPSGHYYGSVARWDPGAAHGFIVSDGATWYASIRETPGQVVLPKGTPVTFTGQAAPAPGKLYPRARSIIPQSGAPAAQSQTELGARVDSGGSAGPDGLLTAPKSPESRGERSWLTFVDSAALIRWREKLDWSRGELARRSGVSVTTINRIEQAEHPSCHIRTARRLAEAIDQPIAAITARDRDD